MSISPKLATIQIPDLPGPISTKSSTPAADTDDGIQVQFDGVEWIVEDDSLDQPLKFAHMADAEAKASHLAKESGRGVTVRGRDGELLNQYGAIKN